MARRRRNSNGVSSHKRFSKSNRSTGHGRGKPGSETIFPCTPMPMLRNQISQYHDDGGGMAYWY